jgi:transcriptional regulator with XRE-family HTH domain
MDYEKIGALIRRLRQERGMTQRQLAEGLGLSPKTVSKWERALGCPDVSLLSALSALLQVDVPALLAGELAENQVTGGNMKKTRFFVCPVCGSLSFCTGEAAVSCCGRPLEPLEPRKALPEEKLRVTDSDGDWYVESDHPARKDDYISFLALVTGETLLVLRQYPEWEIHARLPGRPHGKLVWYSTSRGLFYQLL